MGQHPDLHIINQTAKATIVFVAGISLLTEFYSETGNLKTVHSSVFHFGTFHHCWSILKILQTVPACVTLSLFTDSVPPIRRVSPWVFLLRPVSLLHSSIVMFILTPECHLRVLPETLVCVPLLVVFIEEAEGDSFRTRSNCAHSSVVSLLL